MRDVLFFNHSYLVVKFASQRRTLVKRSRVHIVIHRLLFGGGNGHNMKHGREFFLFVVDMFFYAVIGMAVFGYGRTSGHYLGIFSHKSLRLYALLHFKQIRIAVKMVKVFEQRKVECLFYIRIAFLERKFRRQIDRKMLVAYSMLENILVLRFERGYTLLLLCFAAPYRRQSATYIVVVASSGKPVRKVDSLKFRTVHKYDSQFGIGVCRLFVVCLGSKLGH